MPVQRKIASVAGDGAAVPTHVRDLCQTLRQAGHEAYVVGGATRDLLLGRLPISDWDVATAARPEEVMRLFRRVIPTGMAHGTVTVLARAHTVEVTTYRADGPYSDGRHPDGVRFVRSLKADLARRDFTINAIALDPLDGSLHDPMKGVRDLERRVIRAVGDPRTRFSEDALRVLRAARFAAVLEFSLADETAAAMPFSLPRFGQVSGERIREELLKLLSARRPSLGLSVMHACGLLVHVLPELPKDSSAADPPPALRQALRRCDHTEGDVLLRLAALLAPLTFGPASGTTPQRNRIRLADSVAERLRLAQRERTRLVHLLGLTIPAALETLSDAAVRRFIRDVGTPLLADVFALGAATILAPSTAEPDTAIDLDTWFSFRRRIERQLASRPALSLSDLAIDGGTLVCHLGQAPGPWVGDVLRDLLERVIEQPALNEERTLIDLAQKRCGGDHDR